MLPKAIRGRSEFFIRERGQSITSSNPEGRSLVTWRRRHKNFISRSFPNLIKRAPVPTQGTNPPPVTCQRCRKARDLGSGRSFAPGASLEIIWERASDTYFSAVFGDFFLISLGLVFYPDIRLGRKRRKGFVLREREWEGGQEITIKGDERGRE
ncbi:hypothetical protein CEXT_204911 [Caerostris extrusa]|uniref:Uncharacterized protein n=1 Tax=Caerostris extrusa TaxID=172846 RepID=A0AAV4XKC6_CAEEX|nr:hypothetical protein CEXT_204911 [Caerostris extrusa]